MTDQKPGDVCLYSGKNMSDILCSCKSTEEALKKISSITESGYLPTWTTTTGSELINLTKVVVDAKHIPFSCDLMDFLDIYACSSQDVNSDSIVACYLQFCNFVKFISKPKFSLSELTLILQRLYKLFKSLLENHRDALLRKLLQIGEDFLDSVVDCSANYGLRRLRIEELNDLLKVASPEYREVFKEKCASQIKTLCDTLKVAGNYDFQTSIVEAIFRLSTTADRIRNISKWFPVLDCTVHSLFTRISDFDPDCRRFLNAYNASFGSCRLVYTFPCLSAFVGKFELVKPKIQTYEKFWIDFNTVCSSVLIFHHQVDSTPDQSWENLNIYLDDIKTVTLYRSVHSFKMVFVMKQKEDVASLFHTPLQEDIKNLISETITLEFECSELLQQAAYLLYEDNLKIVSQEPEALRSGKKQKKNSESSSSGKRTRKSVTVPFIKDGFTSTSKSVNSGMLLERSNPASGQKISVPKSKVILDTEDSYSTSCIDYSPVKKTTKRLKASVSRISVGAHNVMINESKTRYSKSSIATAPVEDVKESILEECVKNECAEENNSPHANGSLDKYLPTQDVEVLNEAMDSYECHSEQHILGNSFESDKEIVPCSLSTQEKESMDAVVHLKPKKKHSLQPYVKLVPLSPNEITGGSEATKISEHTKKTDNSPKDGKQCLEIMDGGNKNKLQESVPPRARRCQQRGTTKLVKKQISPKVYPLRSSKLTKQSFQEAVASLSCRVEASSHNSSVKQTKSPLQTSPKSKRSPSPRPSYPSLQFTSPIPPLVGSSPLVETSSNGKYMNDICESPKTSSSCVKVSDKDSNVLIMEVGKTPGEDAKGPAIENILGIKGLDTPEHNPSVKISEDLEPVKSDEVIEDFTTFKHSTPIPKPVKCFTDQSGPLSKLKNVEPGSTYKKMPCDKLIVENLETENTTRLSQIELVNRAEVDSHSSLIEDFLPKVSCDENELPINEETPSGMLHPKKNVTSTSETGLKSPNMQQGASPKTMHIGQISTVPHVTPKESQPTVRPDVNQPQPDTCIPSLDSAIPLDAHMKSGYDSISQQKTYLDVEKSSDSNMTDKVGREKIAEGITSDADKGAPYSQPLFTQENKLTKDAEDVTFEHLVFRKSPKNNIHLKSTDTESKNPCSKLDVENIQDKEVMNYIGGGKSPSKALISTLKILADYPVKPSGLKTPSKLFSFQTENYCERSGEVSKTRSEKKRRRTTYPSVYGRSKSISPSISTQNFKDSVKSKKRLFDPCSENMLEETPPENVCVTNITAGDSDIEISRYQKSTEAKTVAKRNATQQELDGQHNNKEENQKKSSKQHKQDEGNQEYDSESAFSQKHQLESKYSKGKWKKTRGRTKNTSGTVNTSGRTKNTSGTVNTSERANNTSGTINTSGTVNTKAKKKRKERSTDNTDTWGFLEYPEIKDYSPPTHTVYSDFDSSAVDTDHSWFYKRHKKRNVNVSHTYKNRSRSRSFSKESSDEEWAPFKPRKRKEQKIAENIVTDSDEKGRLVIKPRKLRRPRSCQKAVCYVEGSTDSDVMNTWRECFRSHGKTLNNKENLSSWQTQVGNRSESPELLRNTSRSSVDSGPPTILDFRLAATKIKDRDMKVQKIHSSFADSFGFSSQEENDSCPKQPVAKRVRKSVEDTEIKNILQKILPQQEKVYKTRADPELLINLSDSQPVPQPPNNTPVSVDVDHNISQPFEACCGPELIVVEAASRDDSSEKAEFTDAVKSIEESTGLDGTQTFDVSEISEIIQNKRRLPDAVGGPLQSTLIHELEGCTVNQARFSYVSEADNSYVEHVEQHSHTGLSCSINIGKSKNDSPFLNSGISPKLHLDESTSEDPENDVHHSMIPQYPCSASDEDSPSVANKSCDMTSEEALDAPKTALICDVSPKSQNFSTDQLVTSQLESIRKTELPACSQVNKKTDERSSAAPEFHNTDPIITVIDELIELKNQTKVSSETTSRITSILEKLSDRSSVERSTSNIETPSIQKEIPQKTPPRLLPRSLFGTLDASNVDVAVDTNLKIMYDILNVLWTPVCNASSALNSVVTAIEEAKEMVSRQLNLS